MNSSNFNHTNQVLTVSSNQTTPPNALRYAGQAFWGSTWADRRSLGKSTEADDGTSQFCAVRMCDSEPGTPVHVFTDNAQASPDYLIEVPPSPTNPDSSYYPEFENRDVNSTPGVGFAIIDDAEELEGSHCLDEKGDLWRLFIANVTYLPEPSTLTAASKGVNTDLSGATDSSVAGQGF